MLFSNLLQKANKLYLFQKFPFIKQLIKFFLVGTSNTALDFIVYIVLTRIFHVYYLIATTISFIVAVTWSFYLNRRWTFRVKRGLIPQYGAFFLVNTAVMLLNVGLLYVFVDYLKVDDLLAKLGITLILGILNFTVNKFWTFRPKIEKTA
jgi:putative flippase GtrA